MQQSMQNTLVCIFHGVHSMLRARSFAVHCFVYLHHINMLRTIVSIAQFYFTISEIWMYKGNKQVSVQQLWNYGTLEDI